MRLFGETSQASCGVVNGQREEADLQSIEHFQDIENE